MKKIKINTKLSLNKEALSIFLIEDLSSIKGGTGAGPCYSMTGCVYGPKAPLRTDAIDCNTNTNGGSDGAGYVEN
jgi:hypothetical protein